MPPRAIKRARIEAWEAPYPGPAPGPAQPRPGPSLGFLPGSQGCCNENKSSVVFWNYFYTYIRLDVSASELFNIFLSRLASPARFSRGGGSCFIGSRGGRLDVGFRVLLFCWGNDIIRYPVMNWGPPVKPLVSTVQRGSVICPSAHSRGREGGRAQSRVLGMCGLVLPLLGWAAL